jgi:hypothetical protein
MKAIEICQKIVYDRACFVVRPRADTPGEYDAKLWPGGSKRGWIFVDLFTASAIVAVYNALNETNKTKFSVLPIEKMSRVAFKLAA